MITSDMKKQGVTARSYSANSASLIRHRCPLGGLWEMLPRGRNVVPVSVPLPEAGGGSCQGEICSHIEARTACSLSEHDGKCTSFFGVFTKCKSVKPLMVCHLDGKCSPFMGRQVKCRAYGCRLFFALIFDVENIQFLGWLLPYLCVITVNNIKRTIIWPAPPLSSGLKPKRVDSSVKEEAEKAPHLKCKETLEMHVSRRKKKKKHVFVCRDRVGDRTERRCRRPCGEEGKQNRRM